MTNDDVRSIFRNISDVASFSSQLVERLETIFNRRINDSGSDEDNLGKLFLEIIPDLGPLYATYLETHSAALSRLRQFSQSPGNRNYASSIRSHLPPGTPDLASFLEKPKQRIPEYCRLLRSIINASPVSHRDLTALFQARDQMNRVARTLRSDRKFVPFIRSFRTPTIYHRTDVPANSEAHKLTQLENRLRQYPAFLDDLAQRVNDLEDTTRRSIESLQRWNTTFGAVLGLGQLQSAPYPAAYAAFTSLLSSLSELCTTLEANRRASLLGNLKMMTERPMQLLDEMHTLELRTRSLIPKFLGYLSKKRRRYIDLRSTLSVELPLLLNAMDRVVGLAICITIQRFLQSVKDRWILLFHSLVEDGEHDGGTEEILRAWDVAWNDGRQMLLAWEREYIPGQSAEQDVHPSTMKASSAEVPSANDMRNPDTMTSNLISLEPTVAPLIAPTVRRRKTA